MASLLQTIKDLDIHIYKCTHAYTQNRYTHISSHTDTQNTKIGQSTILPKYNYIMLINFQLVLPKFIFSFIVNFVHDS